MDNFKKLATSLKEMNFEHVSIQYNIDDIMGWIQGVISKVQDGDSIFFYYFGHCYGVDGANYLIPHNDNKIISEDDVELSRRNVKRIIDRLKEQTPSGIVIAILDCYKSYLLTNVEPTSCK